MSELAVKPIPRRGRLGVILVFALGLLALGYAVVQISTQKPDTGLVHVAGAAEVQEIFGGVRQEGDRLGPEDAPVTIQVFNDLQCESCRQAFLGTIPTLTEKYVRNGDVKLLYRHYSNAENTEELGFYGAEAAAEQGYGWQYTYLFFRNQEEAKRVGVNQDFLASVAASVGELDVPEWEKAMEEEVGSGGTISQQLESYESLGRELGIRVGQAMIVTGPNGTKTLQDSPKLAEVEQAIAEVE